MCELPVENVGCLIGNDFFGNFHISKTCAKRCGFCHADQLPVSSLVEDADDKLFEYVLTNTEHSLNELLPDRRHELT